MPLDAMSLCICSALPNRNDPYLELSALLHVLLTPGLTRARFTGVAVEAVVRLHDRHTFLRCGQSDFKDVVALGEAAHQCRVGVLGLRQGDELL